MLINSSLFAINNRFTVCTGTKIFTSKTKNSMNTKQTANSQEEEIKNRLGKNLKSTKQIDATISTEHSNDTVDSVQTESTVPKRLSVKQKKASLEEYKATFLHIPKLEDRKPVFVSREVRDSLDEIVRKLGGRRMSVSGFIENLVRHHLELYQEDVESWKKL